MPVSEASEELGSPLRELGSAPRAHGWLAATPTESWPPSPGVCSVCVAMDESSNQPSPTHSMAMSDCSMGWSPSSLDIEFDNLFADHHPEDEYPRARSDAGRCAADNPVAPAADAAPAIPPFPVLAPQRPLRENPGRFLGLGFLWPFDLFENTFHMTDLYMPTTTLRFDVAYGPVTSTEMRGITCEYAWPGTLDIDSVEWMIWSVEIRPPRVLPTNPVILPPPTVAAAAAEFHLRFTGAAVALAAPGESIIPYVSPRQQQRLLFSRVWTSSASPPCYMGRTYVLWTRYMDMLYGPLPAGPPLVPLPAGPPLPPGAVDYGPHRLRQRSMQCMFQNIAFFMEQEQGLVVTPVLVEMIHKKTTEYILHELRMLRRVAFPGLGMFTAHHAQRRVGLPNVFPPKKVNFIVLPSFKKKVFQK